MQQPPYPVFAQAVASEIIASLGDAPSPRAVGRPPSPAKAGARPTTCTRPNVQHKPYEYEY